MPSCIVTQALIHRHHGYQQSCIKVFICADAASGCKAAKKSFQTQPLQFLHQYLIILLL